jgi:hypothetical protein
MSDLIQFLCYLGIILGPLAIIGAVLIWDDHPTNLRKTFLCTSVVIYAMLVLWLISPLVRKARIIFVELAEYHLLPLPKIQSCNNDDNKNEEINEICGDWANDTIPAPETQILPFDSESHWDFLKRYPFFSGKI